MTRHWVIPALLFAVWIPVGYWFIPWLIDSAYHGKTLPILNRLISGQAAHPVNHYLTVWSGVAQKLTLGLLLASFAWLVAWRFRAGIQTRFDRLLGPAARPLRILEVVLLCVWTGLATGTVEVMTAAITFSIKRSPNFWYAFEAVWMAPLSAVIIFLALGCLLLLPSLRWRSMRSFGVTTIVLSVPAYYILLRILPLGLFAWSALLLSVGLAVTHLRLVSRHSEGYWLLVRRSTIVITAMIVVIGTSFPFSSRIVEQRAMARLGRPPTGLPNVLLIILDTVRAHNLSLYGYQRTTSPNLASLAKDGIVFENALAPSSWTLPSHASIFTGRHPFELSADWEVALNNDFPTLAEVLTNRDYATAGFVANYFYTKKTTGLSRGFIHYDAKKVSVEFAIRNSWAANKIVRKVKQILEIHTALARKTDSDVNAEFFKWLPTAAGRPFFVFLNYFGAHDPYRPPEPYNSKFGTGEHQYWLDAGPEYSPAELADLVNAYDGAIAYVDDQVGRLLRALEESGILQNTIVIITADHGEQFGERSPDLVNHGNSLYLSTLHVPLLIRYPQMVPGGQRIHDPVTLRDIPATITDMLGASVDSPFPGRSLARFWMKPSSTGHESSPLLSEVNPHDHIRRWEPAHAGRMKSLLRDTLHYIRNGDGREELYSVVTDPWERHDISRTAEGRRELPGFRNCLREILKGREHQVADEQSRSVSPYCSSRGHEFPTPHLGLFDIRGTDSARGMKPSP